MKRLILFGLVFLIATSLSLSDGFGGGGSGGGSSDWSKTIYSGFQIAEIYDSTDTAWVNGSWYRQSGNAGTLDKFSITVASATLSGTFGINFYVDGVEVSSATVAVGVTYQLDDVDYTIDTSSVIVGIGFRDVTATDKVGGVVVTAIFVE